MTPTKTDSKIKTRILLHLWAMDGLRGNVRQTEVTQKVKKKAEKAGIYAQYYEELEREGDITIAVQNRSPRLTLTALGFQNLRDRLKSPDFEFASRQYISPKDFNALLKWIRHLDSHTSNTPELASEIASYETFKTLALQTYSHLDRGGDCGGKVPIYRIRREIGDRVTRSQFNTWMLQMQIDGIFQFQGGNLEDGSPDKIEDSIDFKLSALQSQEHGSWETIALLVGENVSDRWQAIPYLYTWVKMVS